VTGPGTLRLTGAQAVFAGNESFADGRLIVQDQSTCSIRGSNSSVGWLEVQSGSYAELAVAGSGGILHTSQLLLYPGATFDVRNNSVLVDYGISSPWSALAQSLRNGYHNGAWDGAGLRSSWVVSSQRFGLACVEARDVFASFPATFNSQPIDDTTVLITPCLYGDANIDGHVNLADFNRLASRFGTTVADWSRGDFTYDGQVNLADFNRLAGNFGQSDAPETNGSGVVPAGPFGTTRIIDQLDDASQ
jgi:hypothetical protein